MKTIPTTRGREVEDLVRCHQSGVRGFLLFLGCPRRLVDDLVQDVFLSVLSSPFEDRGPQSTAAFLRTVAKNLFLKAMQRERRQPLLADLAGAESVWVAFEGGDGGGAYMAALRRCLDTLGGKAREALSLRYERSFGRGQIADHLGLSESGVKSILVRARKVLRDCVERKVSW